LLLTAILFLGPLFAAFLTAVEFEHDESPAPEAQQNPEPSPGLNAPATPAMASPPSTKKGLLAYIAHRGGGLFAQNTRWQNIRNLVAAPICEEVVFRSCVLVLLVAGEWDFGSCVFLSPFLFGAAHLHHLLNHVRSRGLSFKMGLLVVGFQLFYTTVFGAYASFLYLRTGHTLGIVISHTFCNLMGFPETNFMRPWHPLYPKRKAIIFMFVVGMVAFAAALYPMTEPSWYGGSWPLQQIERLHRQAAKP
jgi:hypothetical protein